MRFVSSLPGLCALLVITAGIFLCEIVPASAAEQYATVVAQFHSWEITRQQGNQGCYITSTPAVSKFYAGIRNLPYFVLYHTAGHTSISLYAGFPLSEQKPVTITIADRSYSLKTHRLSFAQTYSSTQDADLINKLLQQQGYFTISTYDETDAVAVDYYPLAGLKQAVNYAQKHC